MPAQSNEIPECGEPDWAPTAEQIERSNIGWLMRHLGVETYEAAHQWTATQREAYWQLVIERLGIRFRQPYQQVLELEPHGIERPVWLPGARLNIAESCFTAPPETPALIYQKQGEALERMTYGELNTLTDLLAAGLQQHGYRPGDAIAVLMPMTPESVIIYLGILKAGCVVVGIADSFQVPEISTRLRIADVKAVFTQDVVHRNGKTFALYDNTVKAGAARIIVVPAQEQLTVRLRADDLEWKQLLVPREEFVPVELNPESPSNILFSSGTTGDPKAILWDQTTPIKCAADGHFHQDIQPGDVVVWPTNLGWMMGPWLIFASLINRATIGLFTGAPNCREFGEFVQNSKANVVGVIPSLVKTWRTTGCMDGLDWTGIKLFSSTGECSNAADMRWLMNFAGGKPVIEYCGGTELAGSYIGQTIARPIYAGTFNTPILGWDFVILNEEQQPAENGELFLIPPSIGGSSRLLNADHHSVYFEGTPALPDGTVLRRHGDQMRRLPNGYWQAQGRADDTMNLGGIKVSSAEIERAMQGAPGVLETAAIALADQGGPSLLVVYAVCAEPQSNLTELKAALQAAISRNLNPLFKIHEVVLITSLPRTASNKVMRRTLRDLYRRST